MKLRNRNHQSNKNGSVRGFKRFGAKSGFSLAVVGMLAAFSCDADKGSELGINLKLETATLKNGLKVIMVEDHTVPVVSYQSWFRVGSVDENPGITGISHLFEHLMFKGTTKYGPKEFFQQLEAKGAEVNAFTTRDYTVYYENFIPSLLGKVVEMEADRLANLKLDDEVLNSERMVVFEERRMRTDNSPDGRMQESLWEMAFQVHPYRWPVIGYPQDLARITTPELISYFKAHYQPADAALVVVGDIVPSKTLELIKRHYEPIAAQPRPKRDIRVEPDQKEERRLVQRDQIASERFVQGYHIPSAHNDDSYALDVLANILFGGTTSRGYLKLIEEKDVAIAVSGNAFTPSYPGLFLISATMKTGETAATGEALVEQVVHQVQENGVTESEIHVAIKQLTVQLVDSVRTANGMANLLGTVQSIYDDPSRYKEDLEKYLKVNVKDVQRVAKKYLVPNNRSVVTLIPGVAESSMAAPAGVKKEKRSDK